jgi:hypothetical protein
MFDSQDRKHHFGLLIMRLGIAAVLLLHALPKLFDGTYKRLNCRKNDTDLQNRPPFTGGCVFPE